MNRFGERSASFTALQFKLLGGAEKFIVNAALALKQSGHEVTLYTTHHDGTHCFEETLDKGMFLLYH